MWTTTSTPLEPIDAKKCPLLMGLCSLEEASGRITALPETCRQGTRKCPVSRLITQSVLDPGRQEKRFSVKACGVGLRCLPGWSWESSLARWRDPRPRFRWLRESHVRRWREPPQRGHPAGRQRMGQIRRRPKMGQAKRRRPLTAPLYGGKISELFALLGLRKERSGYVLRLSLMSLQEFSWDHGGGPHRPPPSFF